MKKKVSIVLIILFTVLLNSQDKKQDLSSKREKLLNEIEYTSKLLESTTQKRGQNIEKVRLLDKRLGQRSQLIASYEEEVYIIELKIKDKEISVNRLEQELEHQKILYAEFIRFSYKNYDDYSKELILLASSNLNQFYLRKKYIEQLTEARKNKIILVKKIKSKIKSELSILIAEKKKKETTLESLRREYGLLNSEKSNREQTIKDLAFEEKNLRDQIEEKKRVEKEIASRLEELIREEAKKSTMAKLTPEQKLISSDFEKNKGRLPWPTRQGVITEKFGEHAHPVIKDLIVRNNGIDITTGNEEIVRSVFDGEVSKVFAIKGANYTVIVKHGSYYTVYHNLYGVKVNVGDIVKTKSEIGKVSKTKSGNASIIHFEMYKGVERLNPEEWISN